MSDAKHTPAPWYIGEPRAEWYSDGAMQVYDAQGAMIADCVHVAGHLAFPQSERRANARLIAAAPDLRAALENALALLTFLGLPDDCPKSLRDARAGTLAECRAALAKAEGGESNG